MFGEHTILLVFVFLYLIGTLAIGAWAGTRIKDTADFAVAGHRLPLIMVITTSFATWFGAETVMGIPAEFAQGGLNAVIEDPFGASMCLVLVGAFFAMPLYKLKLLTIGDFYRLRYGKFVEILCSVMIILSYLGWVAAQITALGVVFSILSGDAISEEMGMVVGTVLVLIYVMMGGMLAVAWTDFIQMIVLVLGLSYIAYSSANLAGGSDKVFAMVESKGWFHILPEPNAKEWIFFIAAGITMMLGSIPQQDVFQRVMSAKDAKTARLGAIIGGLAYLAFAFVPMFIVASAILVIPEQANAFIQSEDEQQLVLPTLILTRMPLIAQILFFGALVSAIKSCSSATLLAPATSFVENILRHIVPQMGEERLLKAMRISIFVFSAMVLSYAILMKGSSIYELVSSAYKVTLVGSFVPLTFGLYWKRATTQGAFLSIFLGIATWIFVMVAANNGQMLEEEWGEAAQLPGLIAALIGMVVGSLIPQVIPHQGSRIEYHT